MTTTTNRVTVKISRTYRHAPETVFDAWLTPERAAKFLFATPDGQMVKAQIDPKVGGRFNFTDRRDGADIEHVGEYLEIDRPRRLVFTFTVPAFSREETTVIVEIAAKDAGCVLTLTHERVLPEYAEQTRGGWTMILDGLERALDRA